MVARAAMPPASSTISQYRPNSFWQRPCGTFRDGIAVFPGFRERGHGWQPRCVLTGHSWMSNQAVDVIVQDFDEMFSRLVAQICSHISGEEEAIRVMSLKASCSHGFHGLFFRIGILSPRFTREAAMMWGRWLMPAVAKSCSWQVENHAEGPSGSAPVPGSGPPFRDRSSGEGVRI